METKSPEIAIIYNRLNLSAVIATAIIKNSFEGAKVYDVSVLVPTDSEHYIWVGVDPKRNIAEFFSTVSSKQHDFVLEPEPIKPLRIQLNPFKTQYPELEDTKNEEGIHIKSSLIKSACEVFGIKDEGYDKLDFHVARFHDRGTEIEYLAYVYANLKHAERCIVDGIMFTPKTGVDEIEIYMRDIKRVRNVFHTGYRQTTLMAGEKVLPVVHTSISDSSFHLALRLMRLAHSNFINMTMGMSGAIAYTNVRNPVFESNVERPLVLN